MGDWARAAEHNSEKTGTVCVLKQNSRGKRATLSDEPVVHRIASSGITVVMPYITVHYTPIDVTYSYRNEACLFAGTSNSYIDCAYANFASSLETAIVSSLGASHTTTGSGTCTYSTLKSPHEVLNVLEGFGYRVVAAVTINQRGTVVWTLHKQG